jgi:hypothetical protein
VTTGPLPANKSQGKDPTPGFENSGETATAPYGLDARCEPRGRDVPARRQGLGRLPANKSQEKTPPPTFNKPSKLFWLRKTSTSDGRGKDLPSIRPQRPAPCRSSGSPDELCARKARRRQAHQLPTPRRYHLFWAAVEERRHVLALLLFLAVLECATGPGSDVISWEAHREPPGHGVGL